MIGLHPIFLSKPGPVQRALGVVCPICHEQPNQACKVQNGRLMVHDARESLAYHGRKIWL
jgi:hypothetical protein